MKKRNWLVLIILILISSSLVLANVDFSITTPITAFTGSSPDVAINFDTGGDTVSAVAFTMDITGVATLASSGIARSFASNIGPNFNCVDFTPTKWICSISGTTGAAGGSGVIASVPLQLSTAGAVSLTLSGLSAQDDFGNQLLVNPAPSATLITIQDPPPLICGDGIISGSISETCDDLGIISGDGCSFDCQTESDWKCINQPSVCYLACGDGIVDPGESCDDGNILDNDGCSSSCQIEVCSNDDYEIINGCSCVSPSTTIQIGSKVYCSNLLDDFKSYFEVSNPQVSLIITSTAQRLRLFFQKVIP